MPPEDWVDEVLRFWFEETGPKQWFEKDEAFDAGVRQRFLALHERLARKRRRTPASNASSCSNHCFGPVSSNQNLSTSSTQSSAAIRGSLLGTGKSGLARDRGRRQSRR